MISFSVWPHLWHCFVWEDLRLEIWVGMWPLNWQNSLDYLLGFFWKWPTVLGDCEGEFSKRCVLWLSSQGSEKLAHSANFVTTSNLNWPFSAYFFYSLYKVLTHSDWKRRKVIFSLWARHLNFWLNFLFSFRFFLATLLPM